MKNPLKDILISLFFLYLFVQTYDICFDYYKKISFISQYESDDFSRFRGVSMMLRGTDSADNYVIYGEKELYHNVCSVPFTIVVDQRTLLIVNLDSSQKERLDSIEFQQLIYSFFKYDIPRIDVDLNDNVYIYTLKILRHLLWSDLQMVLNLHMKLQKGNGKKLKVIGTSKFLRHPYYVQSTTLDT